MQTIIKTAESLILKKKTIAIAESCTGGLLTNQLTNISGSSKFLWLGIIAYDNKAKIKLLNIPSSIIKKHGSVSIEVAQLMALNVRKILKTDFGIGITGLAGPTGGTRNKPVGLVYISVSSQRKTLAKSFIFKGSRLQIKKESCNKALAMLLELL